MTDQASRDGDADRRPKRLAYGLLLPHFGSHASRLNLVEIAPVIERYGFDAVWVRDHLVYRPHAHEDPDPTNVDPIVTLAAVAAVTNRLTLATGTLIPHRHPIHTALLLGSLDLVAGPDRLLIGIGLGNDTAEFAAIGQGDWDRRRAVEEYVAILRSLLAGETVTHQGEYYNFDAVAVRPVPRGGRTPIWYGGSSPAAVRRAVEYCDGWMPSRIPRYGFTKRMTRMRDLADEAGRPLPGSGTTCYISPGRSVEEGLRAVHADELIGATERAYGEEPTGRRDAYGRLDGAALAGTRDDIIEGVRSFQALGAEHFVFDLRPQFDRWRDHVDFLGEEVLPALLRDDIAGAEVLTGS
jgi:probable F420-dependent oxidoreductase